MQQLDSLMTESVDESDTLTSIAIQSPLNSSLHHQSQYALALTPDKMRKMNYVWRQQQTPPVVSNEIKMQDSFSLVFNQSLKQSSSRLSAPSIASNYENKSAHFSLGSNDKDY